MKFSAAIAASLGAMVHLAFGTCALPFMPVQHLFVSLQGKAHRVYPRSRKLFAGAVVINEASYTTVPGACDGNVYVELRNTGSSAVSLAGYVLHDSEGANSPLKYTFPAGSIIAANAIALYCQGDTFQFGISFNDTVSLLDATSSIVSTTGKLWMPYGQSLYTMQRKENGSYRHYGPTPGNATSTTTAGYSPVVISEIADRPVANWCDGHDYVELLNIGPEPVDFSGYVLHDSQGPSSAQAYTFPAGSIIAPKQCLVFCQLTTFQFELSQNTTAGYFGANSANYVNEQVMLRDEIGQVVSAPIVYGTSYRGYETYQRDSTGDYYYRNPTPGHDYGASFIAPPIKPPSRAPSLVAAPTKAPTSQGTCVVPTFSF